MPIQFKTLTAIVALMPYWVMANAEPCDNACQRSVVEDYFEKLSVIYRAGSTDRDIDVLFESLGQSVRYQHLNHGADFTRAQWQQAFKRNLDRGAYTNTINQSIRVETYIHGNGYVAVSYSFGSTGQKGEWQPHGEQNLMALFKITDRTISSLQEYW